jgi:omega-amidase
MQPAPPTARIAIAQIAMHWSSTDNMAAIRQAMHTAQAHGAQLCAFSELAITGFHKQIAREAQPHIVGPALQELQALCATLHLAIAVGAPSFAGTAAKYNAHVLIDEHGEVQATVCKQGLTDPEATFFERGASRPVGILQGLRCSAVICREVEDLALTTAQLPAGTVDVIWLPGALRQDPEKPRTDPPEYVHNAMRLAAATQAWVVQTNWPNALNRPEESVDGGHSVVVSPRGELMFRLPRQASGLGIFNLGDSRFDWHPQ